MVTVEQMTSINSQYSELVRLLAGGSIDPQVLQGALQRVIDEAAPRDSRPLAPFWSVSPETQIERARKLWPGRMLPDPPARFTPKTESEVLLLHVPDTFDRLWGMIDAPAGYSKYRWGAIKDDTEVLRPLSSKAYFIEPVWLAFDPEQLSGSRPVKARMRPDVAGCEVLSALIQFPDWPLAWGDGAAAPCLSGLELMGNARWTHTLCISLDERRRRLSMMSLNVVFSSCQGMSTPTVRKVLDT